MLTNHDVLLSAQALDAYTLDLYRHLHRHPETAHHEVETNRLIRSELDKLGIAYLAPMPNITIAVIQGAHPGATVGLRADTDALPVQEETGLPHASEVPGVMHACGHDGHTAIALSAARILHAQRAQLHGRVKVIFQPAEEGEAGAQEVIATGLVNDVDVFFAIHLWSPHKSGMMHASATVVSAAVNMFRIRLTGRGGHGATPDKCTDALVAGAALVTSLQSVVARRVSPMEPAVLTIGSFHAGTVGNIVAGEAELRGTLRSLNARTRDLLSESLESMTQHIAAAYGCAAEVENIILSDAVHNDPRATAIARECAHDLFGPERVANQSTLMLGDDFADFGRIAPYCYAQAGIANPAADSCHAHHNSRFRIDEDVLTPCVAWTAAFALQAGQTWNQ